MKDKKILVTGGSGFIGSALVKRLVLTGHDVTVFDNQSRGTQEHLQGVLDDIKLIIGDIRDRDSVIKACRGIDLVYHLAFINGTEFFYSMPEKVLDVGVKGMTSVLDACIENNIKELVLASSSEVYQTPPRVPTAEDAPMSIPDPLNPRYSYATGKIVSEIMAINYGRKYFDRVVIFRPHNVYGPQMGWEHVIPQFTLRIREIARDSKSSQATFPIKGTGKETRAFVYIDDFIDGLMLMNEKGTHLGIYHIGAQDEITIEDVAIEIGEYFKLQLDILPGEAAEGSTLRRCPDISKMRALGYDPKVTFHEGLLKTVQWYDEHADQAVLNTTG